MKNTNFNSDFCFGSLAVSKSNPSVFIADIGANHDGNIDRACELIRLAAETGADVAKFQHFEARTIVSQKGFDNLGNDQAHQSNWEKSVFEVYSDASVDRRWTNRLLEECEENNIQFMTTPYSYELATEIAPYLKAIKVGSGDITWLNYLEFLADFQKPLLLATGASTMEEIERAIEVVQPKNNEIVLMQCNTNYTGNEDNINFSNLNVLKEFSKKFPGIVTGLSDHTEGHLTVLGAVSLGAKVIEKHFTDDNSRTGPDHGFAMTPDSWFQMVTETRKLERALGNGMKVVEKNEIEARTVQRRSIRANFDLQKGTILTEAMLIALRPCPEDAIPPSELNKLIGKKLKNQVNGGDQIKWEDLIH